MTTRYRFVLILCLASIGIVESAPPRLKLVPVVENAFLSPVAIANAGDGSNRLFIVDQRGTVSIISSGGEVLPGAFLDVSARLVPERANFDERGLLSIAFHPEYSDNGKFYIYYSAPSPNSPGPAAAPVDHMSVVAEFTISADANIADVSSERILLTFDQPQFNHDGGQLAFGPDGFLYISTGDGGGSDDNGAGHTGGSEDKPNGGLGNSQDLTKLLGKILRIDPLGNTGPGGQYAIPTDNPFAAQDDNARDEIYAYGLRNPWRFSFDRQTGRLFCADVGQGEVEEVNLIESGKNYGWRKFEGGFDFDPTAPTTGDQFVAPIGQYAHPNSNIPGLLNIGLSVTGGHVYRGSLIPDLAGTYIFGDWSSSFGNPRGTLLALEPDDADGFALSILDIVGGNPIDLFVPAFGEDEAGEIYVAGKTTLAPSAPDPVSGNPTGGIFKIVGISSVALEPVADATLYEEENKANGAGIHLFSGNTAAINDGLERRALLKFDIAGSVPSGATIDSVTFSFRLNKIPRSGAVPSNFGLHPVLQDWGEGTVNAPGNEGKGANATDGGATWASTALNAGPDWNTPGGDFDPVASASIRIASARQRYEWTAEALAEDVQGWLDDPASNFGWMLFSDSDADAAARRFDSREANNENNRPILSIVYSSPPPTHREQWLNEFYPNGDFPGDSSDDDHDTLDALLEYGFGTDPTRPDSPGDFFRADFNPASSDFVVQFVRDPRAIDLTYTLQQSSDLQEWIGIASSTAGSPTVPTVDDGTTAITESDIPGSPPLKAVDVALPAITQSAAMLHFRLHISRADP